MIILWLNVAWLVYFNLRAAEVQSLKQWMFNLNKLYSQNLVAENSWYLQSENRLRYGNEHWMLNHVWLPIFVIETVVLLLCFFFWRGKQFLSQKKTKKKQKEKPFFFLFVFIRIFIKMNIYSEIWFFTDGLCYLVKLLVFVPILAKWRINFNDYYKIRRDFVKSFICGGLLVVLFGSNSFLYSAHITTEFMFVAITSIIFPTLWTATILFITYYPLYRQKLNFSLIQWIVFRQRNKESTKSMQSIVLEFLKSQQQFEDNVIHVERTQQDSSEATLSIVSNNPNPEKGLHVLPPIQENKDG
ncbi:hypothetical protein RFI_09950, partial [Reticulomyxa filosa]